MLKRIVLLTLLLSLAVAPALAAEDSSTAATQTAATSSESGGGQGDNSVKESGKASIDDGKTGASKTDASKTDVKADTKKTAKNGAKKDPKKDAKKEPKKTDDTKTKAKASSKGSANIGGGGSAAQVVGSAALRAASVVCGTTLGTPVALVRLTWQANTEQAKCFQFLNESSIRPLAWIDRVIFVPSSVFSGVIQAPIVSAENAWKQSAGTPFSKETFFFGNVELPSP